MQNVIKRILCAALALCLLLSLSVGASAEGQTFTPGTYTSVVAGRNGPIVMQADFSESAITDVRVISHSETYLTGNVPLEQYPAQVVEHQSVALDIVSGATVTSAAFFTGVYDLIKQAGGDPAAMRAEIPTDKVAADASADVVVVGGGAAGLTAATKAAQAGSKVILLEKLDILGGTSSYAIEAFGATEDKTHVALGNAVTSDANAASLIASNPGHSEEALTILANQNGVAADWLRSIGSPLSVAGGSVFAATSREYGRMGQVIVAALVNETEKTGVDIRIGDAATELVMENGAVAGVKVKNDAGEYTISAKAVVLAGGGFGAYNEMVAQYVPSLAGYNHSCTVGAKGDVHKMAVAVGAQLGNMEHVRVNFTYYTDGVRVYYMGCLPNTGAIVVNEQGKRFINDQGGYGVGMKVVEQGGSCWAIFDQSMIDGVADVRDHLALGMYECADTLDELAAKIGVDAAGLAETVETYKGYVANGKDEEFGRAMLNLTFDEAPYYACKLTAHVQGTFGGIVTNTATEVTDANGAAIPGLFAAGECAYVGTNGANPMTVDVVFGGIAGENAAAYAAK
ncbi:MAG: FAD-dependent oxidoreductase [Eubacteriales bacterium]|nr:FAD-dependent oxidoreductase [Eubacteriales bacterium]